MLDRYGSSWTLNYALYNALIEIKFSIKVVKEVVRLYIISINKLVCSPCKINEVSQRASLIFSSSGPVKAKMQIVFQLKLPILLIPIVLFSPFVYGVNNLTYVFISGWPQSGTSLLQQIFSECSVFSTMISKCLQLNGKKCLNWNNEGQWILKAPSPLQPGVMCPLSKPLNDSEISSIRSQVGDGRWEMGEVRCIFSLPIDKIYSGNSTGRLKNDFTSRNRLSPC